TSGPGGGDVKCKFGMNTTSLDYGFFAIVNKFDLSIFEQYLHGISNYGSFRAFADAKIIAFGNMGDTEKIDMRGNLAVNDFHFGKTPKTDYLAFNQLKIGI